MSNSPIPSTGSQPIEPADKTKSVDEVQSLNANDLDQVVGGAARPNVKSYGKHD